MKKKTFISAFLLAFSSMLFTSCLNSGDDSPQQIESFAVYKLGYMSSSEYFVNGLGEKLNPGKTVLSELNDNDLAYINFTVDDYTPDANGFYKITLLQSKKMTVPPLHTNRLDTLGNSIIQIKEGAYGMCLDYLIAISEFSTSGKNTISFAIDSIQQENPKYYRNDTLYVELKHKAVTGSLRGSDVSFLNVAQSLQTLQHQGLGSVPDSAIVSIKYKESENSYKYRYAKWRKQKSY